MSEAGEGLTLGVEEEFFVVDAHTRGLRPDGPAIVAVARKRLGDGAQPELHESQVETGIPVCRSLAEVRRQVVDHRRHMAEAAETIGARIVALGTHPFSAWADDITPKEAYQALAHNFQQLARDALVCGCHVHVGISDPDAAIDVMNRARPWLPVLLALTGNSPYWLGEDTGYASYRTEMWRRWPLSGIPDRFASRAAYDRLLDDLTATGSIDAPGRIYFDVRPSARFPTLEFRIADVCTDVDETVMVAGLVRGLARACLAQAAAAEPVPDPRPELLRSATWRAARFGIDADLVDTVEARTRPAADMVEAFLAFVRPHLDELGDGDEISTAVRRTLDDGTGATRQRRIVRDGGRPEDVVDMAVIGTDSDH